MNTLINISTARCFFFVFIMLLLGSLGLIQAEATRLSDLPVVLQYSASEVLGRHQRGYQVEVQPNGIRAATPAQDYATFFDAEGITLATGQSRLTVQLTAVGYGERLTAVDPALPTGQNNRIEYRRGNVTEWYVNGPLGLQQGFTLAQRPEPDFSMFAALTNEPLTLVLTISAGWHAIVSADARSLSLTNPGISLNYGGLIAVDATGEELPTRFNLDPNSTDVHILVDDSAAIYPLTIDPFFQQAYLKASNAEEVDLFGCSVAISGDYAVVGAYNEDGNGSGESDNSAVEAGAAYLYKVGPTYQATTVAGLTAGSGSADLTWTRGNGDGCAVFLSEVTTGSASPVDNVYYTANSVFGLSDQIETTGWYCVYNGGGTSVTVTGLSSSADYRVHVCEYILGSIHYNTSTSSTNPSNFQTPIAVQFSSFQATFDGSVVRLTWTTESETGVAGFNVLASVEEKGDYIKLNSSLITALGSATCGSSYSYFDTDESKDNRRYKLQVIYLDGSQQVSDPIYVSPATRIERDLIPTEFALFQNYPNPFNPQTTIRFDLPTASDVILMIYDTQGRLVRILVNDYLAIGVHNVIWDGRNDAGFAVTSGLYFYRITAGENSEIRKMTLLK